MTVIACRIDQPGHMAIARHDVAGPQIAVQQCGRGTHGQQIVQARGQRLDPAGKIAGQMRQERQQAAARPEIRPAFQWRVLHRHWPKAMVAVPAISRALRRMQPPQLPAQIGPRDRRPLIAPQILHQQQIARHRQNARRGGAAGSDGVQHSGFGPCRRRDLQHGGGAIDKAQPLNNGQVAAMQVLRRRQLLSDQRCRGFRVHARKRSRMPPAASVASLQAVRNPSGPP